MTSAFRAVQLEDEERLADLFAEIDTTFFRPHPFTRTEAAQIARYGGGDFYGILVEDGIAAAYGILRGLDEGYPIPSLGIAVRTSLRGRGLGRRTMLELQDEARRRGASVLRLRVDEENRRARHLYESLGYVYAGEERGELVMLLDLSAGGPAESASEPQTSLQGQLIDIDDPLWSEVLTRVRHDFYHVPGYSALSAGRRRGRAAAVYVTDGSREMLLPLVLRDIDGQTDATSPYGYPGPLTSGPDPAFLRLALAAGRQVLQQAGVVSAFIRLHPILNGDPPQGVGRLVCHGDTVAIDLTQSPEEIWHGMRSNHRRDILRAQREGSVARVDDGWEHLERFKLLYRDTMTRRSASGFYFFDDAYFDRLRDALGATMRLWVVETQGAIAAAGLFVTTGDIVEYHLSGSDPSLSANQPTKLMIHAAALRGREEGARVLLLGGGLGARDDSLLHFKLGFSPIRHPFSTLRMVLDWPAYRRLVELHSPTSDPTEMNGFFPLYRRP